MILAAPSMENISARIR